MQQKQRIVPMLASLAVFFVSATSVFGQGFAQNRGVAAVVNGEKISTDEVERILHQDHPPAHPLTEKQKKELRQMAIDMLINDALMRQFLAKKGPTVAPAEVEKELAVLQRALAKEKKSYQEFLKETNQTDETLREDILARLRLKRYVVKRLPDSILKPYYKANKVFFDKVYVRASHILLKVPSKATPEQERAIRARLMQIRQEIVSKQIPFEVAARKYSHCPSKRKGGDVGQFPYKFVVAEPFAKAAYDMKVGDISAPVRTEHGYHLIKVTGRTKGEPTTFESAKDLVRQVYAHEVQLIQSIIQEQRKHAKIQVFMK